MPSLVSRAPPDDVLEQTNRVIVRRQIEYGASLELRGNFGVRLQRP